MLDMAHRGCGHIGARTCAREDSRRAFAVGDLAVDAGTIIDASAGIRPRDGSHGSRLASLADGSLAAGVGVLACQPQPVGDGVAVRNFRGGSTGTIAQQRWETEQGEKRSTFAVTAEAVGPDLSYATATIRKAARTGNEPAGTEPRNSHNATPNRQDEPTPGRSRTPPRVPASLNNPPF